MYGTSGAGPTHSQIAHVGFLIRLVALIRAGHALNKVLNAAAKRLGSAPV